MNYLWQELGQVLVPNFSFGQTFCIYNIDNNVKFRIHLNIEKHAIVVHDLELMENSLFSRKKTLELISIAKASISVYKKDNLENFWHFNLWFFVHQFQKD